MKTFIFIFLLIITLSKINAQEYGKEITFDKDHNTFRLNFEEDGAILISVTCNVRYLIILKTFLESR